MGKEIREKQVINQMMNDGQVILFERPSEMDGFAKTMFYIE